MLKKIFFLFILIVFNSCSQNDNEDGNGNNNQNKTIVITSGQVSQVETGSVSFNEIRNDIHVGDIIVSGVAENAPVGFLRRIISVINNDTYTTVTTENSNIRDASNGLFIGTQNYAGEATSVFQNYDANSTISITDDNLDGTLKVRPSYRFNIAIGYTPNGYEFSAISFLPQSENDIDVNMSVQGGGIGSGSSDIQNISDEPKTIYLGTLPIVVTAKVAYEIGYETSPGAGNYENANFIYKSKNIIKAGAVYFPGLAIPSENGITYLDENSSMSISSTFTSKLFVKSKFNLKLYDFTEACSSEATSYSSFISNTSAVYNDVTTTRTILGGGRAIGRFSYNGFTTNSYNNSENVLFTVPDWQISSSSDTYTNCILTDSQGYAYNASSYNNLCYTNENWRIVDPSVAIVYNDNLEYGVYQQRSLFHEPSPWRVPNLIDYQNLLSSLGSNAFTILTDPNGFNAKPYGYVKKSSYGSTGVGSAIREDFNNKAYFITTNTINSGSVSCLVVDFTTQTVYIQNVPYREYIGGQGMFMNYYYSVRLMRG